MRVNQDEHTAMAAAWTKRCFMAGRLAMEAVLRPYDLGGTQWYVLDRLARNPTMQRDLLRMLQIERATLSIVVATLVRKGLVEQVPDRIDLRQKRLRLTTTGRRLWRKLPNLDFIHKAAFEGISPTDIATTIDVLRTATERLENLMRNGIDA